MWPTNDKTEELLLGAKAGDDEAINRLIERHRGAVLRMVQMRLDQKIRRRVDVSDVVQDVMIDATRRLQDYIANPAMPFHLWLRHIAKDRIIDAHRRHRGSQKRSVDREQGLAVPGADDHSTMDLAVQLCDGELTPAAAATQRELAQRVEAAITELGEQDGEIIIMRHYEQLSNQEVALALGLSEPAASMRYLRAVRRLRAMLMGTEADDAD
ncbi:MAG: sigma-70 family RNA polymerase sigma factor [Planctomycetia bacterium]|nr:sigma-70 family RNA polymerase sigma factor [Planctomycetia bacterium]